MSYHRTPGRVVATPAVAAVDPDKPLNTNAIYFGYQQFIVPTLNLPQCTTHTKSRSRYIIFIHITFNVFKLNISLLRKPYAAYGIHAGNQGTLRGGAKCSWCAEESEAINVQSYRPGQNHKIK